MKPGLPREEECSVVMVRGRVIHVVVLLLPFAEVSQHFRRTDPKWTPIGPRSQVFRCPRLPSEVLVPEYVELHEGNVDWIPNTCILVDESDLSKHEKGDLTLY